ncbi:hypothetical protein ACFQVC_06525 [Streptomyces monticola]|uniref:Chitinase n=1 Tax=Streptomyces monticola TaxID=2666263 RepID=A0ABW2JCZ1_9ACTN
MRHALAGAVLGGALALGGAAVTAQAAEPAPSPAVSVNEAKAVPASWHFYKAYWTANNCHNAGKALGGTYKCTPGTGHDGEYKWFLYRWY